jgi:hypothetical protein
VLFNEVIAVCSDGNTNYEVDDVATVRRVVMFKHLAHVVVTVLCRLEVKKRTSDLLMGHAANGLVSSVAGESVYLVPRATADVPTRWFASRVDPDCVTAGS